MQAQSYRIYLLTIVFIVLISFPFINGQITLIEDIKNTENRKLTDLPDIDINHLDGYPEEFEKYFNDHFSIRSRMMHVFNQVFIDLFDKSPMPDQMIIGKDGWLFLSGEELDSYRNKNRLTEAELHTFKTEFEYRKKYLEKRGCKFYVAVAPIKAEIYPEKMPKGQFPVYEKSWGEQVVDYLQKNSNVNTLDLYTELRKNKKDHPLYYKLDNHWNALGAYYASAYFLNEVHKDFPTVTARPLDQFTIQKQLIHEGNIGNMISEANNRLSKNSTFSDTLFTMVPKGGYASKSQNPIGYPCIENFPYCHEYEQRWAIADTSKPKLLIISDSFGGGFAPFAAERFGETVKIFDSWQYKLNEPMVAHEKPDVVLLIMLESNIKNVLKFASCPDVERTK